MKTEILFLILGMFLVTYIPRAIPVLFVGKIKFSPKFERFLNLIPYTAMASLIFPGIFYVDASRPYIGIAGGAVSGILAYFRMPVMVCVLAAVLTDFILYTALAA